MADTNFVDGVTPINAQWLNEVNTVVHADVPNILSDNGSAYVGYTPAGTGAVSTDVQSKLRETVSVKDFGAVGDGIDTGSAFTGTDNTAAFQAALDYCGENKKSLYIPDGKYRFAQLAAGQASLILNYDDYVIFGNGAGTVELFVDESTSTLAGSEDFIRGSNLSTSTSRTLRGSIEMYGFTIRGRWSHSPAQNDGTHFFTVENFSEINIHDLAAYDCRGKFSRSSYLDNVRVHNCRFERISSDCLRFMDANRVSIIGNDLKWIDDDCIALPARSGVTGNPREKAEIIGNSFEQCESVLVLGARNTIVSGNTFKLSKSAALYIGGVVDPEGDCNTNSVVVTNNTVSDTTMRYDKDTNVVLTTNATNAAIVISAQGLSLASTASAYPGYPTTAGTSFVDPIGLDAASDLLMYTYDSSAKSMPAGINFVVSGNTISRTLPPVSAYSDFGYGLMFSGADGWVDPAIVLENFVINGITLNSDMVGAVVSSNTISGFRSGAGVYLRVTGDTPDNYKSFDNINISSNTIHDCMFGVTHSLTASSSAGFSWTVLVKGNLIDCDPYHVSSARTSPLNGTWQTGIAVGARPSCIYHRQSNGWVIDSNVFANSYDAVLGNSRPEYATILNNILLCDPYTVGFSTSNKGIGDIGTGGGSYIHQISMCDPRTQVSETLTSLARVGLTATATKTGHNKVVGQAIIISGAAEAWANGQWIVATVPDADHYTFTITASGTSTATGTITSVGLSYGRHIWSPLSESTSVPTVGKYVTGHFIRNSNPTTASSKTTLGWVRQTVGTDHTVATTTTADWAPLVVATS